MADDADVAAREAPIMPVFSTVPNPTGVAMKLSFYGAGKHGLPAVALSQRAVPSEFLQANAQPGGENRLPVLGENRAGIGHVGRSDQRIAVRARHDLRAGANLDVTWPLPVVDRLLTVEIVDAAQRKLARRYVAVQSRREERLVAGRDVFRKQRERRRQERVGIDLTRSAEHDTIAIDQIDRPFCPDAAQNLARSGVGADHPIERDPGVGAVALRATGLIEVNRWCPARR